MHVIGIDPGISNTGLAIIARKYTEYKLLSTAFVNSKPHEPIGHRLMKIASQVEKMIFAYDVQYVAVEEGFHNRDTAYVMGVVMLIASQSQVRLIEITPQQAKCVSGFGSSATKHQVKTSMSRLLGAELQNSHVADAAAVAIAAALQLQKSGG